MNAYQRNMTAATACAEDCGCFDCEAERFARLDADYDEDYTEYDGLDDDLCNYSAFFNVGYTYVFQDYADEVTLSPPHWYSSCQCNDCEDQRNTSRAHLNVYEEIRIEVAAIEYEELCAAIDAYAEDFQNNYLDEE